MKEEGTEEEDDGKCLEITQLSMNVGNWCIGILNDPLIFSSPGPLFFGKHHQPGHMSRGGGGPVEWSLMMKIDAREIKTNVRN